MARVYKQRQIVGSGFRYDLARAIQRRRLKLGLTIDQAAAKVHMPATTWKYYERGAEPPVGAFAAICKALGVHQKPWSLLLSAFGVQEKWGRELPSAYSGPDVGTPDDEEDER